MMPKKALLFLICFILVLQVLGLQAFNDEKQNKVYLLKIGDKKLREKTMAVSPGAIYSAKTGKAVSFGNMISEMKKSRFIYVGETHNSMPMHDIQFEIIKALSNAGKDICIGMEMFPVECQEVLNRWSCESLTKDDFIREIQWYIRWNFNFGFYEKIFDFAKKKKIPVYALNVPREIITKIRKKGWEALSEEEKKILPRPDLSNEEHRTLIRTIFESSDVPPQMKGRGLEMAFEGLYRAQSAWDETMAFYVMRASQIENKQVVVLTGSGHLLYNLGINRRVFEKNHMPFTTVVCMPMGSGEENVMVSRSLANFIWGIQEEKKPVFPSIGLSFKRFEGLKNLVINQKPMNGVAKHADFEKGDIILSVDGKNFTDINELRIYLAQFTWGDKVTFRILRNGSEQFVALNY